MKKLKLLVIGLGLLIAANTSFAQNKTGYISLDQMVGLMPETAKLDSLLQRYQADSLNPQFAYLVSEYNRKDSMVNTKDSIKLTAVTRKQIRQELEGIAYQVQNWQPFVQQDMNRKRDEILEPIYRKVVAAIQQVAKDNGYSYIYTKESLLVAPPADDVLPLVAKKLNVKLPPGLVQPAGSK